MVVSLRSSFGLVLAITLVAACGDESPATGGMFPYDQDPNPSNAGDGGVGHGDAGDPPNTPPTNTPPTNTPPINPGGGSTGNGDAGLPSGEGDAGANPDPMGDGDCCPDGNCLCHGDEPTQLTSAQGPFDTAELRLSLGTVSYPVDAEPPFAAVAVCGGFTNTGPEMAEWAPFYASHGIVSIIVTTGALDDPGTRGKKMLAALEELREENDRAGSPLFGKLDVERVGTSGYSMGGGGTTYASVDDPTIKTSVGLAAWNPATRGVTVPTLLLCGTSDTVAACGQSEGAYRGIQDPTPKMMVAIDGTTHFGWFGPRDAGRGISGQYALAFQKVYLEGDLRWRDLLISNVSGSTMSTNIQ